MGQRDWTGATPPPADAMQQPGHGLRGGAPRRGGRGGHPRPPSGRGHAAPLRRGALSDGPEPNDSWETGG